MCVHDTVATSTRGTDMNHNKRVVTASTIAVLTIPVAAALIGTGGGTAGAATALGPPDELACG
jgi:acetyl-CoA carboxylase alpha subunit